MSPLSQPRGPARHCAARLILLCCHLGAALIFGIAGAHAEVCGGSFQVPVFRPVAGPSSGLFQVDPGTSSLQAIELAPHVFLLRAGNQLFTVNLSSAQAARVHGATGMGGVEFVKMMRDGRALVFAENGLFRLHASGNVEQLADCDRLGSVASTDDVMELLDGRLVLSGSRGLSVLSPDGTMQKLTSFQVDYVDLAGDGSLLFRVGGELMAVGRDGVPIPISTGAIGASNVLPLPDGRTLVYTRDGEVMLLSAEGLLPLDFGEEARIKTFPVPLQDGSIVWLTSAGVYVLKAGGPLENVAPDIRFLCHEDMIAFPGATPLALNQMLIDVGSLLVLVDAQGKASLVHRSSGCDSRATVAIAGEGSAPHVAAEGQLHRLTAAGTLQPLSIGSTTGPVHWIQAIGEGHLAVTAENGYFLTDAQGNVHRLTAPPTLAGEEDGVERITAQDEASVTACTKRGKLVRFTMTGEAERMPGVDDVICQRTYPMGRDFLYVGTPKANLLIRRGVQILALSAEQDESPSHWIAADGTVLLHAAGKLFIVPVDGEVKQLDFSAVARQAATRGSTAATPLALRQIAALLFVDALHGFAIAGPRGLLARSEDGGITWVPCTLDGESIAEATALASSADAQRVWAATKGALYDSADGGRTWSRHAVGSGLGIFSIAVFDRGSRLIVMARENDKRAAAEVFESEDGGQTWHAAGKSPCVSASLPAYDDASGKAWCVVSELLFESVGAGRQWRVASHLAWNPQHTSLEDRPSVPFYKAGFWDDMSGCAVGNAGVICTSKGDGDWQNAYYGASNLMDAAFAPELGRAWVVGTNGTILSTEDRGKNWTPRSSGTNAALTGVYFLPDGLHGWAWGEDGLRSTQDGGVTWKATNATAPKED